jgi:hypothetical protein
VRFALTDLPAPATCWASAVYPDKSYLFTNQLMSSTTLGTFNYTFTVPSIEGVYEYQAICQVSPGRNITRSKAFHVSSSFRLLSELIEDQVRFIDQSMDLQRHDQPIAVSWKLDSTEDVNITDANCWVENDDGGFDPTEYDVERRERNWCVSYYPPNTGPFILARNNDYFPGGSSAGAILVGDQQSIIFSSPYFSLDVTHFLSTSTGTNPYAVLFELREVDTGELVASAIRNKTNTGTLGASKVITNIGTFSLERGTRYNLSITQVSGTAYYYDQEASSIEPLIDDTNPYGLIIENQSADVLWFSIYGNATYRPTVVTTIDNDADSFKALWTPLERSSGSDYAYPGGAFSSTGLCGDTFPSCSYPSPCGGNIRTTELNKSLYFYHNHNYNTVCDVTYEVNNLYVTERLEHQTFLKDRGLRAVIIK